MKLNHILRTKNLILREFTLEDASMFLRQNQKYPVALLRGFLLGYTWPLPNLRSNQYPGDLVRFPTN